MTTPRPDLVNLPQLTTPSTATTVIVVQDSAVNQYLTVEQARSLLSLTVGYSGSRGQVGFVGSQGYTGSQGDLGYTGSTGTQGLIGYTGSTGTAATVAVGLVTISTSTATVTNVGTQWAAIFDFVLQRGPIGYTGSTGTQGLTGYTGSTGTQGNVGFVGSAGPALSTATDIAGGAAGSIPIQAATSVTTFIPIGANGQLLQALNTSANWVSTTSLKVGFSVYSDLEYITQLTTATTPSTRYLTMAVGANSYAGLGASLDLSYDTADKLLTSGKLAATSTASSFSTSTGALTVAGGVGIGGDLFVGGTLYVPYVNTATNLKDGTAGQVPYQTAPGQTSFYGPGTAGDVLVSNGTSAPSYNNTLTLAGTTTATSTQSGALVVAGGVGIGGNLWVGGEIVAQRLTIEYTTVTTTLVQTDDIIRTFNSTNATSTATGALQVVGGVGIGGDLWVGGTIYTLNVTAGKALNIAGGSTGTVLFQSASSSTAFTGPGSIGNILVSRGIDALGPVFDDTSTFVVGYANTAFNSATAINASTASYAVTATNLAGGTAGQVPYQIAPGQTRFFGAGTAGDLLISNGTTAPTYNNTLTLASLSNAISTATGALQVKGGAAIGLDFYVGGDIYGLKEITAYYGATSDARLKTDIKNIDNGLAKVIELSGVTYDWNELAGNKFGGPREVGVLAQEVQRVLPEAVVEKEDGYLTVKYDRIIPLLIEAIKELSSEIEILKKKIQ